MRLPNSIHRLAHAMAIAWLAASLTAPAASAQTASPPEARGATGTSPSFRALDLHDRRQALADIQMRLVEERENRRQESAQLEVLADAVRSLGKSGDDDDRLRECLRLQRAIVEMAGRFRESRLRGLEILDRIQEQSAASRVSPDGGKLLREADRELRSMLDQQQRDAAAAGRLRQRLEAVAAAVPPPALFENDLGVTMRLAGKGAKAIYVSQTPLSVANVQACSRDLTDPSAWRGWQQFQPHDDTQAVAVGVSWEEAKTLARWASLREGREYRLPTVADARLLAEVGFLPAADHWLADAWEPQDPAARRDMRRFGIAMGTIWGRGQEVSNRFGEVPFARYDTLAVYLVTDRQTGLHHRLKRLRTIPE